jgi:hypothetical protein
LSLPPDAKKAYGLVSALGTKLGERARGEPGLVDALRATPDLAAFRALVTEKAAGLLPPVILDGFFAVVTEQDWLQWRSRLILQVKLTRDGGKPAAGHEAGRGVGKP